MFFYLQCLGVRFFVVKNKINNIISTVSSNSLLHDLVLPSRSCTCNTCVFFSGNVKLLLDSAVTYFVLSPLFSLRLETDHETHYALSRNYKLIIVFFFPAVFTISISIASIYNIYRWFG